MVGSAAAEAVRERIAERVKQRGVPVVIPHERLHPAQDGAVLVAEAAGDHPLEAQREDVPGALLLVMQFRPDTEEEIVGAVELLALGSGEELLIDEGLSIGEPALDLADPEQILVIAQTAAAVLHVRFLERNGTARLVVPVALIGHAPGEILLLVAAHTLAIEGLLEFVKKGFIPGEIARLQQGGLRAQIAVGLGHQFLHRPGGVADLEPDVPQHVKHVLDEVVDPLRRLRIGIRVKEEDIDIAVGIQFAAPEAADGEENDTRHLSLVKFLVRFPRAVPEMTQHDGHDVGALLTEITAPFAPGVFKLEAMLLQLEEAAVNIQQVAGPQVRLVNQFALGVT